MYLARKQLARPFAELAAQFGRDHTTVLHAWRIVRARLQTDRTLATTVTQIEERLLSGA
jgi:chromosomal replication initiation ATPase DnaA